MRDTQKIEAIMSSGDDFMSVTIATAQFLLIVSFQKLTIEHILIY